MSHRHKQAAGLWKNVSGLNCAEPPPDPKVKKASTNINLLCGEPQAEVRCSSGKQLGMHPGSLWPSVDWAPDPPPCPNSRQEVWKKTGGRESASVSMFMKKGKKCVSTA